MSTNDFRGYYLDVWIGLTKDHKLSSAEADRLCDKYKQIIIDGYEEGEGPVKISDQIATQDKREGHEPGTKWSDEIRVTLNGENDPNDKWVKAYAGKSVWNFFDDVADALPVKEAIKCIPDRYMEAFKDYCAYYGLKFPEPPQMEDNSGDWEICWWAAGPHGGMDHKDLIKAADDKEALRWLGNGSIVFGSPEEIMPSQKEQDYLIAVGCEDGNWYNTLEDALKALRDARGEGLDVVYYIRRPDGTYLFDDRDAYNYTSKANMWNLHDKAVALQEKICSRYPGKAEDAAGGFSAYIRKLLDVASDKFNDATWDHIVTAYDFGADFERGCSPEETLERIQAWIANTRGESMEKSEAAALNRITMADARRKCASLQKSGKLSACLHEVAATISLVQNALANSSPEIKDNALNSTEKKIVARAVLAEIVSNFNYQPEDLR